MVPCALRPGDKKKSQLLLDFKASFDNFDEVAQHHNFTGWSDASSSPCNWTGIGCSNGRLSVSLRYLNLTGRPSRTCGCVTAYKCEDAARVFEGWCQGLPTTPEQA